MIFGARYTPFSQYIKREMAQYQYQQSKVCLVKLKQMLLFTVRGLHSPIMLLKAYKRRWVKGVKMDKKMVSGKKTAHYDKWMIS